MDNKFYVYILKDPDTLLPFYVGKGHGRRAKNHKIISKRKRLTHKDNKILKLINQGKSYIIEYFAENLTELEAFELEKELILKFGRIDLGTGILCNHTIGGEGNVGWSELRKEECSKRMKGVISAKDASGNIFRVESDDPRWLSGELVGVNNGKLLGERPEIKNTVRCKDAEGNYFSVSKDDPKWLSGELVGVRKGLKPHINSINGSKAKKGQPKPEGFGEKVSAGLSGKVKSESHKEKLRQSAFAYYEKNGTRKNTLVTKEIMSNVALDREKKECPHCNRLFDPGNYAQWHGDKCKMNPNQWTLL